MTKKVKMIACRFMYAGLLLAFAVVLPTAVLAAHDAEDGDPYFKIGKNGEVKFDTDVQIGDVTLKKGRYVIQHRIEGSGHTFVFVAVKSEKKDLQPESRPIIITSKGVFPGEKLSQSVIHAKESKDRSVHVRVIEVAGENMDHTF